ncbi:MAG: acetate--CoA ligase family protein [Candidatus Natronoplasma sp.]
MDEGQNLMDEKKAKDLLKDYGISRPDYVVLKQNQIDDIDIQYIVEDSLDYPLVAKVLGLAHKTEKEAVQVGINTYDELLATLESFTSKFEEKDILIEQYIPHDIEFIAGVKKDDIFGHVLMFGGGGIMTELYQDVAFRKPPIDEKTAEDMVHSTSIGRVFKDYRGFDYDVSMVKRTMEGLSRLVEDKDGKIKEIDMNPLIFSRGDPVALDASIVTSS